MVRSLRRRLRRAVTVIAISVGLVAAIATPAHALWIFYDNFENNPGASWTFEMTGAFSNTNGIAHSGSYYADFSLWSSGWASVDRSLTLPQPLPFFSETCTASAWFSGIRPAKARLEIINPVNWTYVTLGTWDLGGDYVWQQNQISWTGGPRNVVLRLTMINDSSTPLREKMDDPSVTCTP